MAEESLSKMRMHEATPAVIWDTKRSPVGSASQAEGNAAHSSCYSGVILKASTPRLSAICGSDESSAIALQDLLEEISRKFCG